MRSKMRTATLEAASNSFQADAESRHDLMRPLSCHFGNRDGNIHALEGFRRSNVSTR